VRAERSKRGRRFTLLEVFITLTLLTTIGVLFSHRGIQLLNHYRFENKMAALASEISLARVYATTHNTALDLQLTTTLTPTSTEFTPNLPTTLLSPLKVERPLTISIQASGWIDPTTINISGLNHSGTITIDLTQKPAIKITTK